MEIVVPTAAQKNDPLYKLDRLETTIRAADERGLKARWQSGLLLRELREQKYEMTVQEIADHLSVNEWELRMRMRFAESEDALSDAITKGWSWYMTTKNMAELVGRKRKPKKNPVVVKEFTLLLRRVRTTLHKVHAKDLTEADFKLMDVLQEEIARIYDEVDQ